MNLSITVSPATSQKPYDGLHEINGNEPPGPGSFMLTPSKSIHRA
ncbi:hypothetical protein BFJ68_g18678 [Fusarium oxysporum]|uniref:Uncharacterized protein n=1 Tax=Fusarium oxysporum TaxID=5507 RepID=A0A420MAK8_FUSOX|nr:hypothetical protein BFJ68_g18678 [Fusarium oxysporum]